MFVVTDPTKISHISLPESPIYKVVWKTDYEEQVFVNLISRGVFNLSELIESNGEYFSLWVNIENIPWKLSVYEVSADIILQSAIFYDWVDKCWIPEQDLKSPQNNWNSEPFATNNFRWNGWNYVMFDMESESNFLVEYTNPEQVLNIILEWVLWLYKQDPKIISDHFIDSEMAGSNFWKRVKEQCWKLLQLYKWESWEQLFYSQAKKAKFSWELTNLYNNFISNITLIHEIFQKDLDALPTFVALNKDRAKRELIALEERKKVITDFLNTWTDIEKVGITIDPSKTSYITLPDNAIHYMIHDPNITSDEFLPEEELEEHIEQSLIQAEESMFAGLVCQWILNFSQVIKQNEKYYSLFLDDTQLAEKLLYDEILADICLFQLLIEYTPEVWPPDRKMVFGDDSESKTHPISAHNCIVSQRGTYSIFDIDGIIWHKYNKNTLLRAFVDNIMYLIDCNYLDLNTLIAHGKGTSKSFTLRIINRVQEFLERYSDPMGKTLFFKQCKKSWVTETQKDSEEMYDTFISNLRLIHKTFTEDESCVLRYIVEDSDFLNEVQNFLQRYLQSGFSLEIERFKKILDQKWK